MSEGDIDGFLDNADEEPVTDVDYEEVNDSGDTVTDLPEASDGSFVQPADDPQKVVNMYEQFEEIKASLLSKEDMSKIGGNMHVNKSGWRKIATLFNLSVETFEDERTVRDGVVYWRVKARAEAPNGKVSVGSAMCASNESNHMRKLSDCPGVDEDDDDVLMVDGKKRVLKDPRALNEHNIYAIAETRAKNRAISDMVGGGEVSAEELNADQFF